VKSNGARDDWVVRDLEASSGASSGRDQWTIGRELVKPMTYEDA
jgi:hypothetical protein